MTGRAQTPVSRFASAANTARRGHFREIWPRSPCDDFGALEALGRASLPNPTRDATRPSACSLSVQAARFFAVRKPIFLTQCGRDAPDVLATIKALVALGVEVIALQFGKRDLRCGYCPASIGYPAGRHGDNMLP